MSFANIWNYKPMNDGYYWTNYQGTNDGMRIYPNAVDIIDDDVEKRITNMVSIFDGKHKPTMDDLNKLPNTLKVEYILKYGKMQSRYPPAPRVPFMKEQHHQLQYTWMVKNWIWQLDCYMIELMYSFKFFPSVLDILDEDTDLETLSRPTINIEEELSRKVERVFRFLKLLDMSV